MPPENVSFLKTKDLFRETQELFDFIEKEKNVQLGLIDLIKGVNSCEKDAFADPGLSSTLAVLTAELKTSICSQQHIQADLSEVVRTISDTLVSKEKDIPVMCTKEVSCDDSKVKDSDDFPTTKHKTLHINGEEIAMKTENESCNEVALIESFEDCDCKNKKNLTITNKVVYNSRPNFFIYSVDNFYQNLCKEEEEWSEPFYTSHNGYRMKAKLGFSCRYIGIYVKMVRGDFDDCLRWPFRDEISFTLLNQIDEEDNITRILKPEPCDSDECGYWIKPEFIDPCLGGWGLRDFINKKYILGPNGDYLSNFLRNDRIYIKIKVLD